MEEDKKRLDKLKKKEKIYKKVIVIEIIVIVIALIYSTLTVVNLLLYRNDDGCMMSELEKESFNSKFEQYCGNRIRGAQVKALIMAINTNNSATEDESRKVILEGKTNKSEISTEKTYKVEITEYTKQGLINKIRITENEN